MSTPTYKGSGQPMPAATSGITGWLGGLFGGGVTPPYKTTPTAAPPAVAPVPVPPAPAVPAAPACPAPIPMQPIGQGADAACAALPFGLDGGDAVIPVGPGPITIVINPRA